MSRSGVSLYVGCVLCVFILGLTACRGDLSAQPEIRIGLIAYLRGDEVEMSGQPTVNAAQLAIQEVNGPVVWKSGRASIRWYWWSRR